MLNTSLPISTRVLTLYRLCVREPHADDVWKPHPVYPYPSASCDHVLDRLNQSALGFLHSGFEVVWRGKYRFHATLDGDVIAYVRLRMERAA